MPPPKKIPPVPSASPLTERGTVAVSADYGTPNFRWQMFINAFSLEKCSNGVMLRVAFVTKNHEGSLTAAEVVPIVISKEGLQQMAEGSQGYIADFGLVAPYAGGFLPAVRQFSPLFANHVRLARTGGTGEMAFYTVPIMEIARAVRGDLTANSKVACVQVALLHSDILLHQQLSLALINSLS